MDQSRHNDGSEGDVDCGEIGSIYGHFHRPDPVIAAQIYVDVGRLALPCGYSRTA